MFSLSACQNKADFIGHEYVLTTSLADMPITISFDKDNQYHGQALNSYFGAFSVRGDKLNIEMGGMTKMMGSPEEMNAEDTYMENLQKVVSYKIQDDTLILILSNNKELIFNKRN